MQLTNPHLTNRRLELAPLLDRALGFPALVGFLSRIALVGFSLLGGLGLGLSEEGVLAEVGWRVVCGVLGVEARGGNGGWCDFGSWRGDGGWVRVWEV